MCKTQLFVRCWPCSVFPGFGNPVFLLLCLNFLGSLLAPSANPRRLRQQRREQSLHCSGPRWGGVVGELKELQINIFYDHPSTNYVPPWQLLVAGLCLQRGQEQGLGGTRRERGSERPAPGLNFHLSNPGPADWLRETGPPRAAAPGTTRFLNSLGVFPAGSWVAPGRAVGEEEWGARGTSGSVPLRRLARVCGRCRRRAPSTEVLLHLSAICIHRKETSEAANSTKTYLCVHRSERLSKPAPLQVLRTSPSFSSLGT